MNFTAINDNGWTELGTGLSVCVLQSRGDCQVWVGASAPANTDTGFDIKSGDPVEIPQVAALGGGVWVRGNGDTGALTYAIA